MEATDASLRVLIILDITGSMSNEIQAVKQAVAEMVRLCSEQLASAAGALAFAFITFTEGDRSGCHVSLKETSCLQEAQEYIDSIKLSTPPDEPSVRACGDDGPENQKAALARTTDLDPSLPTVAFLITDAPPHLASDPDSMTARHELTYLTSQRGLSAADAGDAIKCFRATALQHFAGNLVLNCVVYAGDSEPDTSLMRLYSCFAQQTGGMLMQPESRNPTVLANGLTTVVKMPRMEGAALPQPQQDNGPAGSAAAQLEGFRLVDVSGLRADVSSEADHLGSVAYGDSEALFAIAMERMVAVCGSKWQKRALGMTAPAEQLQFVWHAARYIALCSKVNTSTEAVEAAAELSKLQELRDSILEQLPAEQRGHFSVTLEDVKAAAATAAAAAAGSTAMPSVSAISWESVGDVLAVDADWEDWLAAVMRLLLGFPMRLQLPLDRNGQPDFMDAWSAVVEELGVDRISAAEFMQLVGDKPAAAGPIDRASHNTLLVLVEPHDVLATLVFRLASGTQVVDYVTGVLMGAKGFLPNLHAGTAAACLTRLLSTLQPLSCFEWGQAQQIAHTLRSRQRNAAKALGPQLAQGTSCSAAEPAAAAAAAAAAVTVKGPAATLLGQTVPLLRSDVPAVLDSLGARSAPPAEPATADGSPQAAVVPGAVTPAVLQALVAGSWCSQGPQALRRCGLVLQLTAHFGAGSEALLAAIRALEECRRVDGFNSRGHSASLRYPGPEGWSAEYAAARAAALAGGVAPQVRQAKREKAVRYIKQMQRFAAVAAWARQAAADGIGAKVAAVAGVLGGEMDANRLPGVVARLEVLLGVKVPAAVLDVQ
ncbi:hypothetical protein OEZ86_003668 [Tetradesmus obliquus]|nr:hypothetical protein OEZ86_003668 [Tetradesmus obliquus]